MYKTLYDKIRDAVCAEKFLRKGFEDKTLMRLKDGTIRPRYCQFCEEMDGIKSIPKVQGWEFNLSDDEINRIAKTVCTNEWDMFWKHVEDELKKNGWDVRRCNFLHPFLTRGKQYAVFCDVCGLNTGWYMEYKDAVARFDEIVRDQIEYSKEREEVE